MKNINDFEAGLCNLTADAMYYDLDKELMIKWLEFYKELIEYKANKRNYKPKVSKELREGY